MLITKHTFKAISLGLLMDVFIFASLKSCALRDSYDCKNCKRYIFISSGDLLQNTGV